MNKLISSLSNWETQTKVWHVLALGAAVKMMPLILAALITSAPVSALRRRRLVLPLNQRCGWVYLGIGTHRGAEIVTAPSRLVVLEQKKDLGSKIQKFLGRMELVA